MLRLPRERASPLNLLELFNRLIELRCFRTVPLSVAQLAPLTPNWLAVKIFIITLLHRQRANILTGMYFVRCHLG